MLSKVIHPKLSFQIVGLCYKTHNELGRFCKEKQYCDRLEHLIKAAGLKYVREFEIPITVDDQNIGGNRVDFMIENLIIVECKAKSIVTKEDYRQVQRYLRASNCALGLIVNFRQRYIYPKRIINYFTTDHDKNL